MYDDPEAPEVALEEGSAVEIAADAVSILDRAKKERDDRGDTIEIDIPSWDGDLKAEYKLLDRSEIEKMLRRVRGRTSRGDTSAGTEADLDFLNKACVKLLAYDRDTDTTVTVSDGFDPDVIVPILQPMYPKSHPMAGQPVPIKDHRQLISYLIGWNNIALAAHCQKLARWMQDTSKGTEDPQ